MFFINVSTKWWDSYGDDFLELKIFVIRILSLIYSSLGCKSNWSTFGIVRLNDFGILSLSWEFFIKLGTTFKYIQKGENCLNQKKKIEWVGICYVKLEDKRENI